MTVISIIFIVIACIVCWLLIVRLVRRFAKFPTPFFVGSFLDSRFRKMLQSPIKVIKRSGIKEGHTVLEIGCGSGAFTTYAAGAVGPHGKVYGLDIEEKMLAQLNSKLLKKGNSGIQNIELVNKSAYELPFNNGTFDVVFLVTVLQEIPDKQKALQEMRRVLKPDGILAVTEWFVDPDYPLKTTTIKQCQKAGFVLDEVLGNWWNYTARFRKA